jgi:hypothetical protein
MTPLKRQFHGPPHSVPADKPRITGDGMRACDRTTTHQFTKNIFKAKPVHSYPRVLAWKAGVIVLTGHVVDRGDHLGHPLPREQKAEVAYSQARLPCLIRKWWGRAPRHPGLNRHAQWRKSETGSRWGSRQRMGLLTHSWRFPLFIRARSAADGHV